MLTRSLQNADGAQEPFRGARRAALLAEALEPLASELSAGEIERLRTALAMLVGVESMVVLRDVLRLEHDDARDAGEWAVRQLVRAARRRPAGRKSYEGDEERTGTRRFWRACRPFRPMTFATGGYAAPRPGAHVGPHRGGRGPR